MKNRRPGGRRRHFDLLFMGFTLFDPFFPGFPPDEALQEPKNQGLKA